MEEKFRRMGLMSEDPTDEWDNDDDLLASISQKEHVEGQEWRAEIWNGTWTRDIFNQKLTVNHSTISKQVFAQGSGKITSEKKSLR